LKLSEVSTILNRILADANDRAMFWPEKSTHRVRALVEWIMIRLDPTRVR